MKHVNLGYLVKSYYKQMILESILNHKAIWAHKE